MKLLNKNVYLDTCSYRKIAKKFLAGDFGENSLSEVMEEIKACEKRMSITVYYNALVVKELAKYLSHDKNSRGYKECSLALRILYMHAEKINSEYLLPLPDIDFFHFIFGFKTDKHKEIESNQIEYLCLLIKHDFTMNDDINTNIDRHFLSNLKESFKQAYISGFINKHSKQHSGWKLTFANEKEREPFLQKFRNRVNKYTDYAYGLLLYTLKESNCKFHVEKEDEILNKIANRYKPMFSLQERLFDLIAENEYNLDSKRKENDNDIIDFLILSSLDVDNEFGFITDESKHLFNYLKKAKLSDSVMLTEDYLKAIQFN